MDEKRAGELRKFLNTISCSEISPFIDRAKVCRSETYRQAIDAAVDSVVKHGNFTLLSNLYGWLHGTKHAEELILFLRPKLNFVVTADVPPKLRKASSREVMLAAAPVGGEKKGKATAPMPIKRLGLEKEERSEDLLDSRLMLPRSFGAGRKR
jgi:hypothetical protein